MQNPYPNHSIPYSPDLSPLLDGSLSIHGKKLANRVVFQPMEGCDGELDGRVGELTARRYKRFAAGGPGIVWLEATAVVPEGRANPRQLYMCEATADSFKKTVEDIKETCLRENGFEPVVVVQLTHSGRWSKPEGAPAPMVAYRNPAVEADRPAPNAVVVTDDYCKSLEDSFGKAAALAQSVGFDGADVKSCHGYLLNELLSAHGRQGIYGGSFENRTRLLLNCFEAARSNTNGGFFLTTRTNAYDGYPYPYGFGVNERDGLTPDLTESLELIGILIEKFKIQLLNVTAGCPYVNPHVNRPADTALNKGIEDPLNGVERILGIAKAIQKQYPELCVVASGFAYLRQNNFRAAAGVVKDGYAKLAGFGRQGFAYPQFLSDIRKTGQTTDKICITCAKCTELMRAGTVSGCVIRDAEVYAPIYRKHVQNK